MRTSTIILFAAVAAAATVCAAADIGPWEPVDPSDPHLQELGRWAVEEAERQKAVVGLTFKRVIVADKQQVVGPALTAVNYRLHIETSSGGAATKGRCLALVSEHGNTLYLADFVQVD